MKVVQIDRSMDSEKVHEAILSHFKWVRSYCVMSTNPDGRGARLENADEQSPDGNQLVERRGQLVFVLKR